MPRIRRIRRRRLAGSNSGMNAGSDAALYLPVTGEETAGSLSRIVIVGSPVFNARMLKLVAGEPGLEVAAAVNTVKGALAAPNEFDAQLIVIEADFGGMAQGIVLGRTLGERRPGCGIMLICGQFTGTVAKHLWVYGAESWSVISNATASNPEHFAEAVSSAVHGITWVEPGIRREMRQFGPRPKSMDERRLMLFDRPPGAATA